MDTAESSPNHQQPSPTLSNEKTNKENESEPNNSDESREKHESSKNSEQNKLEESVEVNCDTVVEEENEGTADSPTPGTSSNQSVIQPAEDPLSLGPELVEESTGDQDAAVENGHNDDKQKAEEEMIHQWPLFSHSLHQDYPDFDPSVSKLIYLIFVKIIVDLFLFNRWELVFLLFNALWIFVFRYKY